MPGNAKLVIDIEANADQAQKALGGTADSASRMSRGINAAAGVAAAGLVAVAGVAMDCAKSASRTQQAFGGLEAVFGSNADQMKQWANTAADSMGLSAAAYAEGAAKIGAQLKNLGVPFDQIAGKTNDLMQLGADLAATYGGPTTDAVNALGAAMRGEADPAERYGLALNQTAINARMAADGTDKLTGKEKQQAKAATILAMATEQAGEANGQFAREAGSAAGSAEIAAANFENAKSALGEALLPALTEVAKNLTGFAQWVQKNSTLVAVLAGILGFLAVAILGVAAAQWAMNAALLANPITWIVIGIVAAVVALIAAIVLLIKHWDQVVAAFKSGAAAIMSGFQGVSNTAKAVGNAIRAAFAAVWNWLRAQATAVGNFITSAFARITAPIVAVANRIKAAFTAAFNLLKSAAQTVTNAIKSAFATIAGPIIAVANRIKSAFVSAFNSLKSAARSAASAVLAPFRAIQGAVNSAISAVGRLIDKLRSIKVPSIKIPSFGKAAPASLTRATSPRLTAASPKAATSGGGVVINITGAVDPESTARQIERILASAQRRRSGVVLRQRALGASAA